MPRTVIHKSLLLMRGADRRRHFALGTRQRAVLVAAVAPARLGTEKTQRLVAASPDTEISSKPVRRLHRLVILSVSLELYIYSFICGQSCMFSLTIQDSASSTLYSLRVKLSLTTTSHAEQYT